MCFGGGGNQRPQVAKYESKNDPVVITGEQEGLEKKKKKTETADSLKRIAELKELIKLWEEDL